MRAEPFDGVADRLLDGTIFRAKLFHALFVVKEARLQRIFEEGACEAGLFALADGLRLGERDGRARDGHGHTEITALSPSDPANALDELEVIEVMFRRDIALTRLALFGSEDVSLGAIADIDIARAAVDVEGRALAFQSLKDELPGRRRPDIARSKDDAGADDADIHPPFGEGFGEEAAKILRAPIGEVDIPGVVFCVLVADGPERGAAKRDDARGIDGPLDVGAARGLKDIIGAGLVHDVHRCRIRHMVFINGGDVEDGVDALYGLFADVRIEDIASDDLELEIFDVRRGLIGERERADLNAPLLEDARDGAA